MRTINAEFIKLFTTRVWFWLTVTVIVVVGGICLLVGLNIDESSGPALDEIMGACFVLAPVAYVVACVVGITGLTGEFRHQTATSTFLAQPRRPIVVAAKLLVYLFYGAVLGIVAFAVIVLVLRPLLGDAGYDTSLDAGQYEFSRVALGVIAAIAFYAPFGVGFGALVRNQPTAITIATIYLLGADKILLAFNWGRDIYPYTPGGAALSMMFPIDYLGDEGDSSVDWLTGTGGTVTLAVWSLGLAIVGSLVAVSRDIT